VKDYRGRCSEIRISQQIEVSRFGCAEVEINYSHQAVEISMKRKTEILTVLAVLLFPAVSALAITYTPTTAFTPTMVQAGWFDGHIYIYGASGVGCTYPTILTSSSQYADTVRMTNLATAAFLSGRKLSCFTSGCDGGYAATYACIIQ
jgi:hypothetical protein